VTETKTIPPTKDDTPTWCQWSVGFVAAGSDGDTVQMIFAKLKGLNVRVTTAQHPEPVDVVVLDTNHEAAEEIDGLSNAGMLFVESDEHTGYAIEGAIPVFVRYEDLRSIDIY
jgi:hypothetical protein